VCDPFFLRGFQGSKTFQVSKTWKVSEDDLEGLGRKIAPLIFKIKGAKGMLISMPVDRIPESE